MNLYVLLIHSASCIISALAGAYIYRKGIQGESVLSAPEKQSTKEVKEVWDEI
jgi:hypothetical protein